LLFLKQKFEKPHIVCCFVFSVNNYFQQFYCTCVLWKSNNNNINFNIQHQIQSNDTFNNVNLKQYFQFIIIKYLNNENNFVDIMKLAINSGCQVNII